MTMSGKTTLALVGSMFASSYVGIALAWTIGGISEWCYVRAENAAKMEEKARQRRLKRNATQTTKEQQEKTDAEIEGADEIGYGDTAESPPDLLHPPGTEVLITAGANESKEGKITDDGFCKRNLRYVVEIEGETWYVPPTDVVSTAVPEAGAGVVVVGGKHAGREGKVGDKHDVHDLYHVVLNPTEQCPLKVFVVQREADEDGAFEPWPIEFGEGDNARTIVKASGAASKAGVKPGMVIKFVNGDALWDELGNISGDTLELTKEEGWWLSRNMFDIFK